MVERLLGKTKQPVTQASVVLACLQNKVSLDVSHLCKEEQVALASLQQVLSAIDQQSKAVKESEEFIDALLKVLGERLENYQDSSRILRLK